MTGPKNGIVSRWGSTALRPVELPSGMKALIRLPDVNDLILRDAVPADLREVAMQYATTGIEVDKLDQDQLRQFVHFTYELVARSIRYMAAPDSPAWDAFRVAGDPSDEGWEAVALTARELQESDVDPADIEALGQIVGRQKTPNEVTALTRFDRGLMKGSALAEAIADESGSRVGDFAPFRPESGGADDGADGEDVRDAAVRPDGDRRPGRRVRGRRSTSP